MIFAIFLYLFHTFSSSGQFKRDDRIGTMNKKLIFNIRINVISALIT